MEITSRENGARWGDLGQQGCSFVTDAAWVIWLRSLRLARGGRPAAREFAVMCTEKWHGHSAYAKALACGRLGRSPKDIAIGTLTYYGIWIRDNRKRLSEEE